MRKRMIYKCWSCILLALSIFFTSCSSSEKTLFSSKENIWNVTSLKKGIVYKNMLDESYLGNQQTIHVVTIDLDECECKLDIAHANGSLIKPSKWASKRNAVAAINGNFFDPDNEGAVCYFRYLGKLINSSKPDPEELLFLPMLDEGGIVLSNEEIRITEKPVGGWENLTQPQTILSSGPLLIKDSNILLQEDIDFMNKKHARTALGIGLGKIFLVIVDGYRPQASGMSINELSLLLKELGSTDAINLDGGGSSTLWIGGVNPKGVVNYPPDNKKFDHKGERKVANAILVVPKPK